MRLNERLHRYSGDNLKEFIDTIISMKNSDDINERQRASKLYYRIPHTNYGIPSSTYFHDYNKHKMNLYDWESLIDNLDTYIDKVESKEQRGFRGTNYLYKYYFEQEFFGVGVCVTKDGYLITTYFRDTENNIDEWLNKNRRTQREVPSASNVHGSPFTEGFNNSITENNKKVKTNEDFNSWFGNSKVVKDGKPLVVYHGSPVKFDEFKPELMNYGSISKGFCFFTNKKSAYPNCAKDYAGKDGYIYECYLKIEKPLHIKYGNTPDEYYHTPVHYWDTCQSDIRREFRKGDFDGIIIENLDKSKDDSVIYLVPNANQIKSVDAKEFSNSKNIYETNEKIICYHGTNNKFSKFDKSFIGNNTQTGKFFNFTDNINVAKSYGDRVLKCEITLESPITYDCNGKSTVWFNNKSYTPSEFAEYINGINQDLRNHYTISDEVKEELEYLGFSTLYADEIDGIILENCNDSFELFNGELATNYIVFNENNIKILETLTEQKVYHGTNAEFDKFDLDKIKDWRYGYGIYFTRSKGYASNYGNVGEYEVPDNEYLLSWEDSYEYQSEYVQDALYKLWKDAKEQGKHQEIEKAIFGDFANDGEAIYYAVSEGLKLSGKATSELLYKYGIKGIDSFKGDCIVIFNPDDIKNAFIKLNKQIESLLEYVTPIYNDCLNQKELINEICKKKYEYRIIYDDNKEWYLIGTAYDKCHEQLLYNSASYYGFTFDEMTDYYNEHYMNLHDLLYTPKEIGLQLGFDHNNKVYTFKGFGSIYTKGEDLPKVLLVDLTSRFGKPIFKEKIKENLTKLEFKKDIIVADNIESLAYFLKTTKKDCRIVIDKFAGLSIISDVTEVHYDAFLYAVDEGWYGEYIEDNDEEYWEDHLESEDLTLLIFSKDSSEEYLGQDGFRYVFEYPFGYIYARVQSLPNELLNVIGQPVSTTESEDLDAGYPWEDWSIENVLKRIPKRETELRDKISKMDIEDLKPYFRQVFHLYYMPDIENLKIKLGMNIYESLSRIIERYL